MLYPGWNSVAIARYPCWTISPCQRRCRGRLVASKCSATSLLITQIANAGLGIQGCTEGSMDLSVWNLNLICTQGHIINKGIPDCPFRAFQFSPYAHW